MIVVGRSAQGLHSAGPMFRAKISSSPFRRLSNVKQITVADRCDIDEMNS